MYERLKEIINSKKIRISILVILFLVWGVVLSVMVAGHFGDYPEVEYQLLEQEAQRIVESRNFETDYPYEITYYNSQTKKLDFKLYGNGASITVNVTDYKNDNPIIHGQRFKATKQEQMLNDIASIVLLSAVLAILSTIVVYVVLGIIFFIVWIVKKIKKSYFNGS